MVDRRDFLRKLGSSAVYAVPVIYTLTTPRDLAAIVTSGMDTGMMMDMMMMNMMGNALFSDPPWATQPGAASPWATPSPWTTPPSGTTGNED